MEKSKIKDQDILNQQPNWIQEFLQTNKISQDQENMALMEMDIVKIEENQQELFLEIPLHQSKNYLKQVQDFQKDDGQEAVYVENSQKLLLWFKNEQVRFCWQESFYTNSVANDPYQILYDLVKRKKFEDPSFSIKGDEDFKFELRVEGVCANQELKITHKDVKITTGTSDHEFESIIDYYQYSKPLQHFIKEMLWFSDSWQQFHFKNNAYPTWKPHLSGSEDLILESSFSEYVVKQYGEPFLREDLNDLPKLIYGQLLEYSQRQPAKFQILKESLIEYKRLEEKWPKDLIEVVLTYYDKNFEKPLHEFEVQIIFIAMRYYQIPFFPIVKNSPDFFDLLGEMSPDLLVEDFGCYFEEFFEWQEWVES